MHRFSELGIVLDRKTMTGEKIEMFKVLNLEISILDYTVKPTKFDDNKAKGNGMCLCLQIDLKGMTRVIFTSSVILQDYLDKITRAKLPFITTIIKEIDGSFRFT